MAVHGRSNPKPKRNPTPEERVLHRVNCIKTFARIRYPLLSPDEAFAALQAESEDAITRHLDRVSEEFPKLPMMMAFSAMAIQKGLPQPFDSISPAKNRYREISGAMMLQVGRKLNAAEKKKAHQAADNGTPVSAFLPPPPKPQKPFRTSAKVAPTSVVGRSLIRKWFPVNSLDLAEPGYCYISNHNKNYEPAWQRCRFVRAVVYQVYDHAGKGAGIQVPKYILNQLRTENAGPQPSKPFERRIIGDGLIRQWNTDNRRVPAEENYVFISHEKRPEDVNYAKEICASREIVYYDVFIEHTKHVGIQIPLAIATELALRRRTLRCIFGILPSIPHPNAHRILNHAFAKNTNRVGSKITVLLPERCRLAILAHIRHMYTPYDDCCRDIRIALAAEVKMGLRVYDEEAFFDMTRRRARDIVRPDVRQKWEEWSSGIGVNVYAKITGSMNKTIFYVKRGKKLELEQIGIEKSEEDIELSDDEGLQDVELELTLEKEGEYDLIELSDDDIMDDDDNDDDGNDEADDDSDDGDEEEKIKELRRLEHEQLQQRRIELERKINERNVHLKSATPSPLEHQPDFGISSLSISEKPSHVQIPSPQPSIAPSEKREVSLLDLDDMPDDLHAATTFPTIPHQKAAAEWIDTHFDTHWMYMDASSPTPVASPSIATASTVKPDQLFPPPGLPTPPQTFRQLPRAPMNIFPPAPSPGPFAPKISGFPGMLGHPGTQQPSQGLLELVDGPSKSEYNTLWGAW